MADAVHSPEISVKSPKRLTVGFLIGRAIWILILIGVVVGTPSVFYSSFAPLKEDYWLHYRGTVARTSEVTYFHHYHKISTIQVCVAYVTQTGHRHHEGTDYDPAFIEPDRSLPMIIRCDPASPLRISISWGRQFLLSRTVAFVPYAFFSAL